jgi:hypothetical protein
VKNVSRQALLAWLEPLLPQIEHLIANGDRLIEVREAARSITSA